MNSELPYQIIDIEFNSLDIVNENLTKRNKFGEICEDGNAAFVIGSNTIYNNWKMQAGGWTFPFISTFITK